MSCPRIHPIPTIDPRQDMEKPFNKQLQDAECRIETGNQRNEIIFLPIITQMNQRKNEKENKTGP